MLLIPKNFGNVKGKDWKDILLGLQRKLNVTQQLLLDRIGLKRTFSVSFWISGRHILSINKQVKFIEFIKKNNLDIKKLIKFGREVRNSIKFDNEWIPLKKAVEQRYFNNKIIVKINGQKYLNSPFLFPKYRNKEPLKFILKDNKIIVFYKGKYNHNLEPYSLLRYLKLDKTFLVGLGIYLGEGARNRKPKVTNSEPLIINQAIKFFRLVGVRKTRLKSWIQLHERSTKSFDEVKKFWLKTTTLNKNNITKIRIKKSSGNAKIKEYGTLHLESTFILSQLLMENLLKLIPKLIRELSQEQIIYFLQGTFAGEGSVSIAKSGSVNMLQYTSTNKKERSMIKYLLEKLGLKVHEDEKYSNLYVMGFFDIQKAMKFDLFRYHPWRKERLLIGFDKLKNSRIPGLNKMRILNLLRKNKKKLTVPKIKQKLELSYDNTKKHLRELYKLNKIKKIEGSGTILNLWFI